MQNIKDILKYLIIGGFFLTPFVAFIVPNSMFFPFITGKGFTFRILVEVIFGLYVMLAVLEPYFRPKMSWLTKSVFIFTFIILIADLFGANVYKSIWSNYERMEGFVLIIHLLAYYIVLSSVFTTRNKWNQFFNVSIIASLTMSIYGLFQMAGKIAINQGGVRVDATFGNASYLAIYLVFHIFLCLYMYIDANKPKWQRSVYGLIAILETVILYYTATRGAILGLVGGLLLIGVLVIWKEKENKKLRKAGIWVAGIVAGTIVMFLALQNTNFVKKSPVLSRFSNLGVAEFQTQGRYFVWPMAVKGIIEHPILGWGQENFNFVFNKYYNPQMFGQEEWFDRTHNVFLDWLIAGGLLGFLAYAFIYIVMFYYIWRKNSPLSLSEKSIFSGMIGAYIFHNIFVFDNLISYILFFSFLAFIHSLSVEKKEAGVLYHYKISETISRYAVFPAVIVLTVGIVYFVNIPALQANQTLIQAITPQKQGGVEKNLAFFKEVFSRNSFGSSEALEQLVMITEQIMITPQVPDTSKKPFYDFAKSKIEEKIIQTPHDARYLVFGGNFFNRAGQYDLAIPYLERAVVESPQKQTILFELGNSYIGKKDYPKAMALFKKAYDSKPSVPEAQIIYAIGAIYSKDKSVLKELAPKIPADKIISDNRFLQAYADTGDFQTVISILNARIQKNPTNLQYKLSLASAYATIGQKQKAIQIINEMIAQEPSFKEQGQIYIKQIQNS